jgi:hypothetical protein
MRPVLHDIYPWPIPFIGPLIIMAPGKSKPDDWPRRKNPWRITPKTESIFGEDYAQTSDRASLARLVGRAGVFVKM